MKRVLFSLQVILITYCGSATGSLINIDGDSSDWSLIAPLIVDDIGTIGTPSRDMTQFKVTNDNANLYMLFEFAGDPLLSVNIVNFNLDTDISTGCGTYGIESGITLHGNIGNDYYWGLPGSCIGSSSDYPNANLNTAYGSNFIEIALDLSTLSEYGIELNTITISPCCDSGKQENYTLSAVPIPAASYLFLSGLIGLIGMRKIYNK